MPSIIRDYFENLCTKKLQNLENVEEMKKFLDTYDLLKFNQKGIKY
jgi:hypothetical protein